MRVAIVDIIIHFKVNSDTPVLIFRYAMYNINTYIYTMYIIQGKVLYYIFFIDILYDEIKY